MRPPIALCARDQLRDALAAEVRRRWGAETSAGATEVDVLHWTGRAALELIGQGVLGYSFDPLNSEAAPPDALAESVKSLLYVRPTPLIFLSFRVC